MEMKGGEDGEKVVTGDKRQPNVSSPPTWMGSCFCFPPLPQRASLECQGFLSACSSGW